MVLCYPFLRVLVKFNLMFVHIFSSVWVAEWLPFRKELLTRLTICSLCILTVILLFPALDLRVGFWF